MRNKLAPIFLSLALVIPLTLGGLERPSTYVVLQSRSTGPFDQHMYVEGDLETFVQSYCVSPDMITIKTDGQICKYEPIEEMGEAGYMQYNYAKNCISFRVWIRTVADTPGDIVTKESMNRRQTMLVVCK